jgi:hypothetical protein
MGNGEHEGVVRSRGRKTVSPYKEVEATHTGGHMLVNTNNGMLLIRSGGLESPPIVSVTPSAISRQM